MHLEFSRQIFEKAQTSSFIKICPGGAELFLADRQTDMTKLIAAFRNFANAPKNLLPLAGFDIFAKTVVISCTSF
jgi:hypothetical protein